MNPENSAQINKSLLRRAVNRLLHVLARLLPGATGLRPFLHRLRGVRIHGQVFIGDDVYIENEYPEYIEIHDGAQVAVRTTIIAHTRGPGKVVIGKNVFIGTNCVIVCSPNATLTIGEGSVVMASSLVTTSIPPFILYGGERPKAIMKVTQPLTLETSYEEFIGGLRPFQFKNINKK